MSDASLRDEELQVLASIYPDYISEQDSSYLRLEIPVELGVPRDIRFASKAKPDAVSTKSLAHLPPIIIAVKLPEEYPVSAAPLIIAIQSLYNWLSCCAELVRLLREMWAEGEGVLCTWVELIRSGDFLDQLGLVDNLGTIK